MYWLKDNVHAFVNTLIFVYMCYEVHCVLVGYWQTVFIKTTCSIINLFEVFAEVI